MAASPLSPRILKAGLVLLDPATSAVKSIIVLQYNPDSLSRNLTPQSPAGEGAGRGTRVAPGLAADRAASEQARR